MELTKKVIGAIALTAAMTAAICYAPLIGGCSGKAMKIDPVPKLEVATRETTKVAEVLPQRAEKIDTSANTIQKAMPEPLVLKTLPSFVAIRTETDGLRGDAVQLQQAVADLDQAKTQVEALKAANGRADAAVAKLEAERNSSRQKLVASLVVMAIIGLGISGALLATGTRAGLFTGVGCAVVLVAAVLVGWYSTWIAIFGGVAVLAGVGVLVKKIMVERKATQELVQTVEVTKQALPATKRKAIFGDHAQHGEVDLIQSSTTQKLVDVQRGKKTKKVRLAKIA